MSTALEPAKTSHDPAQVQLLNRGGLARMFNVSTQTTRVWEQDGRIPPPAVIVGKRKFWRLADLCK